jgi:DNA-binding transcriptional LysR family regulator
VVRAFRALHPDVAIEIREIARRTPIGCIRDGTVDIAFIRPIEDDPEVAVEPLPGDGLSRSSRGTSLAGSPSLTAAALVGRTFIPPTPAASCGRGSRS